MGRPSKTMMEARDLRRRLDDALQLADDLKVELNVRVQHISDLKRELAQRNAQLCALVSIVHAMGNDATVNVPLNLLATLIDGKHQPGASK